MDLDKLKEPFAAKDIEWRIGQSGKTRDGKPWAKVLAYIDNRAVMGRLDEVCGPAGWQNEYRPAPNDPDGKSLLCGIGVEVETGKWVWKWDGANNTDIEGVKGGASDSMKRAAVHWGIGRYLYSLSDTWANCTEESMRGQDGWRYAKSKDGAFWWKPPELPAWAVPPKEIAKGAAVAATRGKVAPATTLKAPEPKPLDYRKIVLDILDKQCGCETDKQRANVLNWVTSGMFTDVAELKVPADARKVHELLTDYGQRNPLKGLAFSNEVGEALGL